jgi:hypothetical protein
LIYAFGPNFLKVALDKWLVIAKNRNSKIDEFCMISVVSKEKLGPFRALHLTLLGFSCGLSLPGQRFCLL